MIKINRFLLLMYLFLIISCLHDPSGKVTAFSTFTDRRQSSLNDGRPPSRLEYHKETNNNDQNINLEKDDNALDRRIFIKKGLAASAFLTLFESNMGAVNAASLEDVQVGGRWVTLRDINDDDNSISSNELSSDVVPSYFSAYLSRILINYDPAAKEWWDSKVTEYSLLPASDVRYKLGRCFGSFTGSVQIGLDQFLANNAVQRDRGNDVNSEDFTDLGKILIQKYGDMENDGDLLRQIGILLTLLPGNLQPIQLLDSLDSKVNKKGRVRRVTDERATLPVGFAEDERLLLPENYYFERKNGPSYQIFPSIVLWEIGIGEEFDEAIGTVFGVRSLEPLQRKTPDIGFDIYKLLAFSGATACALTHTVVIPLDVVKTRLQTDPDQYKGFIDGLSTIAKDEGPSALLLGFRSTIVGFLWYGLSVYPSYDFFKNILSKNLTPAFATIHMNDVALLAGALASVVACIGLAPMETCRIRTVAEPERYCPLGLQGTILSIVNENKEVGWKALYVGFSSILTRQVIFGSVKFLSFEKACDTIYSIYPFLKDSTSSSLAVSLVAGAFAGCLSSVVSQPADSVLTFCAKSSTSLSFVEGSQVMVKEGGLGALFRGLGSRCIWAGSIIAGQFFLYGLFRGVLDVTPTDLTDKFEIFLSTQ